MRPVPERCWLRTGVVVRPSPIDGMGLFTTQPINSGEVVGILGGRVIDDAELDAFAGSGERYDSAAIGEGLNVLLAEGEVLARGNHSCDSNMWLRDAVTLEARRDIATDEELTIDYALLTATEWEMPCRCGSPLCRRIVRGSDWTRPELQRRYAGHFAPFLNARIASTRGAR